MEFISTADDTIVCEKLAHMGPFEMSMNMITGKCTSE